MGHPPRVFAHVGDVVENVVQRPIDLDAFLDPHDAMIATARFLR
jgi:hypothetical protein